MIGWMMDYPQMKTPRSFLLGLVKKDAVVLPIVSDRTLINVEINAGRNRVLLFGV